MPLIWKTPSRQLGAFDNLSVTATMEAETSLDRSRVRRPHPYVPCPCQTACRPAKYQAVSDRPEGSESEFGRQIPVDLEADADLNEGWGCPGHWSSSLFPSDNKVNSGGPLRKPTPHERMHKRRLLSRGILLQPPRWTPGDMPSGVSLRWESHSMPGPLANSLLRMGVFLSH